MRILSLDISTVSTGWCTFDASQGIRSGTLSIKESIDIHHRMIIFKDKLNNLLLDYMPTDIVIEDVWFGKNPKTAKILSKFCGIAEETATRFLNKAPITIENTKVKSFFKCSKKADLFQFLISLLGANFQNLSFNKDNDSIDAIAQLIFYLDSIDYVKVRSQKNYGYLYDIEGII